MKKAILLFLVVLVFLLAADTSLAYHRRDKRVLGESTTKVQIPATVEGPGLILPNSPLFFLDQIKQNVRLSLAFSADDKAKVYDSIAGERMAEMRIMLSKDDKDAVKLGLRQVSDNLKKASEEVNQAKLRGKDVSSLAKKINDNIKLRQKSLDLLEAQTVGEVNTIVNTTQESVMDAKVDIEDYLPEADLENEIKDDLDWEIAREVEDATESVEDLSRAIEVLTREASDAAQKSQERRQEALLQAIERKNENLKQVEERKLFAERKKQESLLKVQSEAALQAKRAVEEAKKAAEKYKEAKKKTDEIRVADFSNTLEIKPTASSGSSTTATNSPSTSSKKE